MRTKESENAMIT